MPGMVRALRQHACHLRLVRRCGPALPAPRARCTQFGYRAGHPLKRQATAPSDGPPISTPASPVCEGWLEPDFGSFGDRGLRTPIVGAGDTAQTRRRRTDPCATRLASWPSQHQYHLSFGDARASPLTGARPTWRYTRICRGRLKCRAAANAANDPNHNAAPGPTRDPIPGISPACPFRWYTWYGKYR